MQVELMAGEARWIVLYDGECGLCKWMLAGLLHRDRRRRLVPVALQRREAEELLADLAHEERMASWHLISPSGERLSGGAALPAVLRLLPAGSRAATGFARFPSATDWGYRWVADHRSLLSRAIPAGAKERAAAYVRRREEAEQPEWLAFDQPDRHDRTRKQIEERPA
jgi:predicted DCC family thiol-disulfide oxidoreductase YuxK